ncbi:MULTISPECIES: ABC transporter substrate-binding protein [unclassified Variovorax]|jgi:urea transport system substrate-binding protein|uniref:urea ABC transporter substrate-binding protein n=1 Tax=unclassified Variovorax TaxID=663243 RepID=UPI002B22990A|nr:MULTISPECIES: ABC transporter substrate-binding protein [unclassified Variovorax]MEB0056299.1 transporter substrate-binding protein [Variovorax sp. LG9.2]MEB0110647.1 transporter substrate-binding protein [Variovorax sp. RTB1]
MDRRSFIHGSAAALAGSALPLFPMAAMAADEIVVGSIIDMSGGLDIYGKPMADCMTLAVEEQNAAGGLLGKKIKLAAYDPQSNMQLYAQFAQQSALKDKSTVVMGGITSASREVIRPVLTRNKTLYFYNTQYEGGVCDRNTFCTGVTPGQTVAKLIPYAMKKWGKKVYVVAADYNYGQITSQWVKKFVQENGGSIASIDFFPLDVTNFGPTISKIEQAKPDMIVSALVGGAHIAFYRQWAAAGLTKKIPLASTTFAGGNEHIVLSPAEADGFLVSYNYFQNVDTPENKAFKERFYKRFGADYPNITELAMGTYQGFKLWAEAVKKAGSIDREKMITALESGISIDGPSGKVSIDPETHHCVLNVRIAEVRNKQLNIVETFQQQPPVDTSAVCNLIKNPKDNQQYVIKA